MTQTPYGIVREACVKANPEIAGRDFHITRLADVLLALKNSNYPYRICCNVEGANDTVLIGTGNRTLNEFCSWNLKNDSLEWHRDNQPETVEWIANLLTNK